MQNWIFASPVIFKNLSLTSKLPSDFIRSIRLKRAAQLLDKSGIPIPEVAYQVGFINPKVFTKLLKEQLRLSPFRIRSEYPKWKCGMSYIQQKLHWICLSVTLGSLY